MNRVTLARNLRFGVIFILGIGALTALIFLLFRDWLGMDLARMLENTRETGVGSVRDVVILWGCVVVLVVALVWAWWKNARRFELASIGYFLGIFAIIAIFLTWNLFSGYIYAKHFTARLDAYIAQIYTDDLSNPVKPYIRMKAVFVDVDCGKIMNIQGALDKDARVLVANSPAQVGTVIQFHYIKVLVGKYGNAGAAYRMDTMVTIVDYQVGKIVGMCIFKGTNPPETSIEGLSCCGEKPEWELIEDYLLSLPRIAHDAKAP